MKHNLLGTGKFMRIAQLMSLVACATFGYAQHSIVPTVGDGSEDNPYQLTEIGHFAWLSQVCNANGLDTKGVFYVVKNDINASITAQWNDDVTTTDTLEGFMPIGTEANPFMGTFNGNRYKMSSLTITRGDTDYVGLFGYALGAEITNFGIFDGPIVGGNYVGSIVGYNNQSLIKNCWASGDVAGQDNVGGLVGYQYKKDLNDCYATVTVDGNNNVGGLVGYNSSSIISKCYTNGDVRSSAMQNTGNLGGIAGYNDEGASIVGTHAIGSVAAEFANNVGGVAGQNMGIISNCYYASSFIKGKGNIGGIAGYNGEYGYVGASSLTDGAQLSGTLNAGGLVGYNFGLINTGYVNSTINIACTNTAGGAVGQNEGIINTTEVFASVLGVNDIGGFAGISNGDFNLCSSAGRVEATSNGGGFVALMEAGSATNCYAVTPVKSAVVGAGFAGEIQAAGIVKCYAAGAISGTTRGGLVAISDGTVMDSYWDKEATGVSESAGSKPVYAKTTTQMKKLTTYAGWDFLSVWDINETESYPYFREGQNEGQITVTIEPTTAIMDGAMWRVDGDEWHASDTTLNLPEGQHTIQFKDIPYFYTPDSQTITVVEGEAASTVGIYSNGPCYGNLTVKIRPQAAIDLGAMWSIDKGVTWHKSDETIKKLNIGPYPIIFKDGITGYITPDPILVVVTHDEVATGLGTYVSTEGNNAITAKLLPEEVNEDGAAWSIDGGLSWYYSGETIKGLAGGMYVVTFKTIDGWTAPTSQAVTVYDTGYTAKVSATYVAKAPPQGTLRVSLVPNEAVLAGAQWSLDGGLTWYDSNVYMNLAIGTYTVSFKSLTGWTIPKSQQVTILPGKTFWINGTYSEQLRYSITVSIAPEGAVAAGALWRVNAEAWQNSGTTIGNLVYDTTYTVQFKTVDNWIAPEPIELCIPAGMNVDPITGLYVSNHNGPVNDQFVDAIDIKGLSGSAAGTNVGAHLEAGEPANGVCSVWWKWTAPVGGSVTINTLGSSFDTRLGVYQGKEVSNLVTIAQDDDNASDRIRSQVQFFASVNQTYYIAVTSCDDSCGAGSVMLNWNQTGGNLRGSLQVSLSPQEIIDKGAQWNVDGGIWRDSETIADNLTVGYHTVSFAAVDGWFSPANRTVLITANEITTATGVYSTDINGFDIALAGADFTAGTAKALTPGDKVDFSWTATASYPFSESFWCEVFPSKTGGFDQVRAGGTVTSSYRVKNGMGTEETIVPNTLTLNPLPDGDYTLIGSVNRGTIADAVYEGNYVNNWLPVAGKRLAIHNTNTKSIDLQMDKIAWTFDPTNPNNLTVTGRVFNSGSEAMGKPGAWIEVFYGTLTAEGTVMIQGTIGAGHKVDTLPVNAPQNFALTGTVAGGAKNKALVVMVDSTNIVSEINKTNNYEVYYLPSILPPGKTNGIDLAVVDVQLAANQTAPYQVAPYTNLNYSVTVLNKGTVMPTDKIYLELFASQDGGASVVPGVTLTWSEQVDAPEIGQVKTYTLSKQINSIGDGLYSLVAMINRDGAGSNPGDMTPLDNRMAFNAMQVSLKTPAKLGKQNLVWYEGPFFTREGSKITVTGTIRNTGTIATGPFWIEAFVGTIQAKTGVFYRERTLQGGDHCIGLNPQEARGISLTGSIKPGQVLGVLADSTDVISETDETDNYDYSDLIK